MADKQSVPCTRKWCDETEHWAHDEFIPHFRAVADFTNGDRAILVNLTETEPFNGPDVMVSRYTSPDDQCGTDVRLSITSAYALAQALLALDPADVVNFATKLAESAWMADPLNRDGKPVDQCAEAGK